MSLQYQIPVPHLLCFHPPPTVTNVGNQELMENIVNTSMNNLPRNWIFSLPETTGCVCSSWPPPQPPRSCRSMLMQLAKCKRCPKTARSGQSIRDNDAPTAKGEKKNSRDSSSLTLLVLLLKTCHRHQQSDVTGRVTEGVVCVWVWVSEWVCVCAWQDKALSIRHYSFKSHLRIVQGLWNWTGPIIWSNVFVFLNGTYYGPCRNIWKGLTGSLDVQPFIAVTDFNVMWRKSNPGAVSHFLKSQGLALFHRPFSSRVDYTSVQNDDYNSNNTVRHTCEKEVACSGSGMSSWLDISTVTGS